MSQSDTPRERTSVEVAYLGYIYLDPGHLRTFLSLKGRFTPVRRPFPFFLSLSLLLYITGYGVITRKELLLGTKKDHWEGVIIMHVACDLAPAMEDRRLSLCPAVDRMCMHTYLETASRQPVASCDPASRSSRLQIARQKGPIAYRGRYTRMSTIGSPRSSVDDGGSVAQSCE